MKDIVESVFYRLVIILQVLFMIEAIRVQSVNIPWFIIMLAVTYLNIALRFKHVRYKSIKTKLVAFSILPLFIYGWLDAILTIYSTSLALLKINTKW